MLSRLTSEELASLYDESREKMLPAERGRWLDQRLAEQVKFAYENAPAVTEKFDKAGVSPSEICTVRDLEKLPVASKDELVRLPAGEPALRRVSSGASK